MIIADYLFLFGVSCGIVAATLGIVGGLMALVFGTEHLRCKK